MTTANAPVALFVYNRPDHTRRTLAALRSDLLASTSHLHVFSDAPRVAAHAAAVAEVRSSVRQAQGFQSLTIVEREQNLGLASSISGGVTRLCEDYGRVIVLEDDLIVAPGFLSFLNRALVRYETEPRVMQISGYMYPGNFGGADHTLFLPTTSCWGWATWKRAWQHYDAELAGYDRLMSDSTMRSRFDLNGAYDYAGMLRQQRNGELDSWGIRWYLTVFLMQGLVLYPARTLVMNQGVDGSGTHGRGTAELQQFRFPELAAGGPTRFPPSTEIDEIAFSRLADDLRRLKSGFVSRLMKRICR